MFRRLLLAILITFSTAPAFADCQSFAEAWHVSEMIAAKGPELSKLDALSTISLFSTLRKNYGAEIPLSWKPEGAIVTKGPTVVIVAPIINGEVCFSVFVPREYFDEVMKGA